MTLSPNNETPFTRSSAFYAENWFSELPRHLKLIANVGTLVCIVGDNLATGAKCDNDEKKVKPRDVYRRG